jgi:hypothetical protein
MANGMIILITLNAVPEMTGWPEKFFWASKKLRVTGPKIFKVILVQVCS